MKRYIATVQLIVEVEDNQAPQDAISAILSEGQTFDWTYLHLDGGKYAYPQEVDLPDDYEEGEAFQVDYRIPEPADNDELHVPVFVHERMPYQDHIKPGWYLENAHGDVLAEGFATREDACEAAAAWDDEPDFPDAPGQEPYTLVL